VKSLEGPALAPGLSFECEEIFSWLLELAGLFDSGRAGAAINWSINAGFKVVLAISVVDFLWSTWKMVADSRAPHTGSVTL
jgi:hypothetical protein